LHEITSALVVLLPYFSFESGGYAAIIAINHGKTLSDVNADNPGLST
jgi:hypothetical protein